MNTSPIFKLIRSVDKAYLNLCRPVLQEYDLTQVSFDILMFLNNNPESCTAKDISEKRNIKPNVISMYVEKLVNDGYIIRRSFEGDRRKIKLILTEKAFTIVSKGEAIQVEFVRKLALGIDEEELRIFRGCISRITDNAENIAESKTEV